MKQKRSFEKKLAILETLKKDLPASTKAKLALKKVHFTEGVMELKTRVTGQSNLVQLLTTKTKKIHGISDWDGNRLPQSTNFVLESIKGAYALGAPEDLNTILRYSSVQDIIDLALLNAKLIIKQAGKELIHLPVSFLFSERPSTKLNGDYDSVYELDSPVILVESKPVQIALQYPQDATVSSEFEHFFNLTFKGISANTAA